MIKLLSFIYIFCRKIRLYLQDAHIKTMLAPNSSMPIIKGKVYWFATNVKVGKNVTIYPGAYLWGRNIEIGDDVQIGIGTIIYSKNSVKIGNHTRIAGQCYIIDMNHGKKKGELIRNQPDEFDHEGVRIGEDVWISSQCSVLKGANIHDHAVIGANSLVNKEIPENAIAFGTPAKVSSYRV